MQPSQWSRRSPYERIEKIDWSGDTFYNNSQVYCHSEGKKRTPYEGIFSASGEGKSPLESKGGPKRFPIQS